MECGYEGWEFTEGDRVRAGVKGDRHRLEASAMCALCSGVESMGPYPSFSSVPSMAGGVSCLACPLPRPDTGCDPLPFSGAASRNWPVRCCHNGADLYGFYVYNICLWERDQCQASPLMIELEGKCSGTSCGSGSSSNSRTRPW